MAGTVSRQPELDVLRGLAVAGMILVVSPGDWGAAYAQLQHAEWNGWTLADMVFPTFLFSVGVALGLSFPQAWASLDDRRRFWTKALRRTALLVVVGLLLETTFNWAVGYSGGPVGKPGLENLRIPGILQRIALCYLLSVATVVATGERMSDGRLAIRPAAIAGVSVAFLVFYWALLEFVPVPGFGAGRLDPEGNLGAYIDRAIFTPAHLWPLGWTHWGGPIVYDPEGLLSTLTATTDVLFGVLAAVAWKRRPSGAAIVVGIGGLGLVAVGLLLDPAVVINKRIWTSSFALLSSGFAAALLAAVIGSLRIRGVSALATPFRVLGGNAILAFILSTLLGRIYDLPIVASDAEMVAPRAWLNGVMLGAVGDARLASTLCAASFLALVTFALWPFHRRALHFRL